MKSFFGLGLFAFGAATILIFGLPYMFSHSSIAGPVVLIAGLATFFSASFADQTPKPNKISVAAALRMGLFGLSILVALVGLVNIFGEGRAAASFYLFVVGLLGAFAAATAARSDFP